jgi:hypothetical protein
LAGQHAGRVVEVLVDLVETVGGSHDCIVLCSVMVSSFRRFFLVCQMVILSGVRGNQEGWGLIQFSQCRSQV